MLTFPQNAHDKVIRAMVKIQGDHPFFSYILMNFRVTATDDKSVPTAGVDKGGNFYYSEEWISALNGDELIGLLVHETLHIAEGDFFRKGNRDDKIWGIASDACINFTLKQEGFKLPEDGILPDSNGYFQIANKTFQVKGKCKEEMYDELMEVAEKMKMPDVGHGGFDIHLPGVGEPEKKDGDGEGDGKGEEGEGNCPKGSLCAAENAKLESKWKKVIIEAATSAQARGKMPGSMTSLVDKLLNPVIDWRTRVMKFITNEIPVDYTNRLPSRKFYGTGVWSPRVLRENLEVFISIDVSGSTMGDRQYFMSEVAAIVNSYEQIKARVIFWDGDVADANDHMITAANKDKIVGLPVYDCNGGTRMSCYAEYCEKKGYRCRLHIILTDGYIESDPIVPEGNVIFVLTKTGSDEYLKNLGAVCRLSDVEE